MAIEAVGIEAGYGGAAVLNFVSFEIQPGELVAIIGPNGSGKSTLIRALSRTLRTTAGSVRILGDDIYRLTAKEAARRVAVVPQHEDQIFDFTVREIVEMGRYARDGESGGAVGRALLATSSGDLSGRPFSQLSGGERQRVLLARALAQETPILLLDEPTAHMDVGYQIATLSLLRKCAGEGNAVAAALHDLNLVSGFADRVILLHGGRIAADGPTEDVLGSAEIERVYGATFERVRDSRTGRTVLVPEIVPERGKTSRPSRVHLVGGGGSAAALLTELWQLGHHVTLGITQALDSDYEAAHRFGVSAVTAPPFTTMATEHVAEAAALAEDAEFVVICAAPYGRGNLANLSLADQLLAKGKRVIVVDRGDAEWDFAGGDAGRALGSLLEHGAETTDIGEVRARLETD
ncbi:MAG: ABC transporter ATP-binding protein [Fimbriimonadales bacterium]